MIPILMATLPVWAVLSTALFCRPKQDPSIEEIQHEYSAQFNREFERAEAQLGRELTDSECEGLEASIQAEFIYDKYPGLVTYQTIVPY